MDILFPGRCILCGEWLLAGAAAPLCPPCQETLRRLEGNRCSRCGIRLISEHGTCTRCRDADYVFRSNVALFPYSGEARRLLNALKFGGRLRLAAWFAEQAAGHLAAAGIPVVPVPARPGRRSPDPVERIARRLSHDHGVTVVRLLRRTGGAPQKTLDLKERRENLLGRIRLAPGVRADSIPPQVVLVDDVFTTGATLDACARVLLAAGCERVDTLTLVIEE